MEVEGLTSQAFLDSRTTAPMNYASDTILHCQVIHCEMKPKRGSRV